MEKRIGVPFKPLPVGILGDVSRGVLSARDFSVYSWLLANSHWEDCGLRTNAVHLGQALSQNAQAIQRALRRLERAGWIRRSRSPGQRGGYLIWVLIDPRDLRRPSQGAAPAPEGGGERGGDTHRETQDETVDPDVEPGVADSHGAPHHEGGGERGDEGPSHIEIEKEGGGRHSSFSYQVPTRRKREDGRPCVECGSGQSPPCRSESEPPRRPSPEIGSSAPSDKGGSPTTAGSHSTAFAPVERVSRRSDRASQSCEAADGSEKEGPGPPISPSSIPPPDADAGSGKNTLGGVLRCWRQLFPLAGNISDEMAQKVFEEARGLGIGWARMRTLIEQHLRLTGDRGAAPWRILREELSQVRRGRSRPEECRQCREGIIEATVTNSEGEQDVMRFRCSCRTAEIRATQGARPLASLPRLDDLIPPQRRKEMGFFAHNGILKRHRSSAETGGDGQAGTTPTIMLGTSRLTWWEGRE